MFESNGKDVLFNSVPSTVAGKMCLNKLLKAMEDLVDISACERVKVINAFKLKLHECSPFRNQPVDCVVWVPVDQVHANDYNPNVVAPPEMKLLERSISEDGYTQPVVTWVEENRREVVDGFHRRRVGVESPRVSLMCHGYLPVTTINVDRTERRDRIAATIRHNRARGKHQVEAMTDIVVELKKRNWSDKKIGRELGMDQDEVLRLCQISGLVEVFSDSDFSQAWDAAIFDEDAIERIDELDVKDLQQKKQDSGRILYQWDQWECYPAGFYGDKPPNDMSVEQCEHAYAEFLADIPEFERGLRGVLTKWKYSCEHYLTNERMNRIAWLGQAAACWSKGLPARFCGGYNLLDKDQQLKADETAFKWLNRWLRKNGRVALGSMDEAKSKTQMDLY